MQRIARIEIARVNLHTTETVSHLLRRHGRGRIQLCVYQSLAVGEIVAIAKNSFVDTL